MEKETETERKSKSIIENQEPFRTSAGRFFYGLLPNNNM
jgi:hypothetical protein